MDSSDGATAGNWTEIVEDLVHGGEIEKAVSYLESTVTNLENELAKAQPRQIENGGKSVDQLCTALRDLSKLYAAQGFSLRADQTQSRAFQIEHRNWGFNVEKESTSNEVSESKASQNGVSTSDGDTKHDCDENSSKLQANGIPQDSGEDDDWEAIADREPEELLFPLPVISKLSLEDTKSSEGTKRRGRGTFYYKKEGLYSDDQSREPVVDESEDNSVGHTGDVEKMIYGTRHVLVLADIPPSTTTIDLEKLLKKLPEKFKGLFVIRWVNDTSALAVFKTPSIALEASKSIQCPFTVRVLSEDDELLSSIPPKDLEPPRQRPQTSASTARRMIAHSMGIKLPSTFGSGELRKQEEARRNRIVARQNMRDDAWGGDDAN